MTAENNIDDDFDALAMRDLKKDEGFATFTDVETGVTPNRTLEPGSIEGEPDDAVFGNEPFWGFAVFVLTRRVLIPWYYHILERDDCSQTLLKALAVPLATLLFAVDVACFLLLLPVRVFCFLFMCLLYVVCCRFRPCGSTRHTNPGECQHRQNFQETGSAHSKRLSVIK